MTTCLSSTLYFRQCLLMILMFITVMTMKMGKIWRMIDKGLFSFGQVLETLWSARNFPLLASKLISRFASQGRYGIDRLYDVWLDRLFVSLFTCADDECYGEAIEAIIERAVEREEANQVISILNQSIEIRSIISKNISVNLPPDVLLVIIKVLCLPVITDSTASSSSDRYDAAKLLQSVLLPPPSSAPSPNNNLKCMNGPSATALLGALIRCLSDRSDTAKTERLKSSLLPILTLTLSTVPAVGRPFHPQLARLAVTLQKDLISVVSLSGNSIDFDQSHPRGQISQVTCKLISMLLVQMSRVDVLLEELAHFRVDSNEIYDDLSVRNARQTLLAILKNIASWDKERFKILSSILNKGTDLDILDNEFNSFARKSSFNMTSSSMSLDP